MRNLHPLFLLLSLSPALLPAAFAQGVSAASEAALHELVAEVSPQRIERDIRKLVSFGTRHTLSETRSESRGIGAARRWIEREFERISAACDGCLEVRVQRGVVEPDGRRIPAPTEVVNVMAILRGSEGEGRYLVMSGDIDSRISDPMNATDDAPGANDNASGMAGVLEAARVLSRRRFAADLVLVGLSGEEQGLYGGRIMAEQARRDGWFIEGLLNNDMTGNVTGLNGVTDNTSARIFSEGTRVLETAEQARLRRFTGGEVDSPSRNLARYLDEVADRFIPNLDTLLIYRLDRFGRGGHHRPFNEAGFAAVRIMETNEHYHRQHQDLRVEEGVSYGDVIAGVDFKYAAKLTSLNVAALAALAWAPAPPRKVAVKGAVAPHTSLSWERVTGAAGYRVHWRLTSSPVWTHSRAVGDVTAFTLENLVIDNYFFGVSSVSADGFASPVVFPGPAGDFHAGSSGD